MIAGKYSDSSLIMPLEGMKIINKPSDNAVFDEVGKVKIFHIFLHGYNHNCGQRSVRLEHISRLTDLQGSRTVSRCRMQAERACRDL